MRVSTLLAAACAFPAALAFPWLETGPAADDLAAMKRGLDAMAKDPALRNQIRELYAEQKREEAAWMKAGKRDIVGSLVNGTIGMSLR